MQWDFSKMIKKFSSDNKSDMLTRGRFGIERESQRVNPLGELALTPHPLELGDKFNNPRITTDFSESQIEIITPALESVKEVYKSLGNISNEVKKGIKGELLWPLSMPPKLPEEKYIPIAKFPDTEEGKEKQIYRNGLALRYGKKMQMISGIHYNFSFCRDMIDFLYEEFSKGKNKRKFIDEMYFALTRNFLRYRWLIIYLLGASPLCDSTYYSVICNELKEVEKCCPKCCGIIKEFNKYAASLRVSRFGYSSSKDEKHTIYFNSLEEYSVKLREMMATESEKYSKLGIYKDGVQIQLNGNLIQSESEFYSPIRLKRNTSESETQLEALMKRGVEYIEIRILDIDPLKKLGISVEEMNFIQVFIIFCLFENSEFIDKKEFEKANTNHQLAALMGRKENILLHKYEGGKISIKNWGEEIFSKLKIIAELMDKNSTEKKYVKSVEIEYKKLGDVSLLPSQKIYSEMMNRKESYLDFGIRYADNM
ncbi:MULTISPECIES: glutamate--cysteine ligase [Clostridium]|uniref:glutamate--cysteine ligase n=1 Tax=Clostridium TaxID=1485 RepID=UPI00082493E5|nr:MULTISPECIES: glutamate--cysteine ligase [Clostridium]PJI06782.1 glutamate--cysteine ligase [Clostridium sp. CT7]